MSRLPTPSDILGSSYKLLPQESQLLLVTSVLGVSPSWLVYSLLNNTFASEPCTVVLVSFLNDYTFFRDGGKRHGVDLQAQLDKGRLIFVDGFSKLFLPLDIPATRTPPLSPRANPISPARGVVPARGAAVPVRNSGSQIQGRQNASSSGASGSMEPIKYISIPPSAPAMVGKQLQVVKTAIKSLPADVSRPRLVIEGVDLLMSAGGIDAGIIEDWIYDLREMASTTAVILPSDSALTHTSPSSTPLEVSLASLLISLGHASDAVLSLRLLDTGVAKDISGVLKVTRGAGNLWKDGASGVVEEKEMLFFESDSGVKMFARGAGAH